jgi:hypothetical protein
VFAVTSVTIARVAAPRSTRQLPPPPSPKTPAAAWPLPLPLASSPRPAGGAAARGHGALSEGPGHGRVQQAHLTESDRACSKLHASERAVTPSLSRPGPGTATRGSLGEIMMTSRACTKHAISGAQLDVMRIRRFKVAGPDSSGIKPISPKLILPFGATQSDVHCTA